MKTLNRHAVWGLAFLLMFSLAGCLDLTVDNNNSPNREQVLASPADVENLIGGSFLDWWTAVVWGDGQINVTAMADEWSVSWANYGTRALSSEPRAAFDNSSSYRYARAGRNPWNRNYRAISNASDGLGIVTADEGVFTSAGIDVNRIKAFAKFVQGIAHGYIALRYDQGFTVDETTDLTTIELRPYNEVMDFAIQKLEEAIAISNAGHSDITAGDDWIFGLDVSSGDLARLSHSFIARFMAQVARDPAERAAVNWTSVIGHVDQGITEDWAPVGDDGGDNEWDASKSWGQEGSTWSRADYRTIGPADESGGYDNWLATPVPDRNVFDIITSDRRISAAPGETWTAPSEDEDVRVEDGVFTEGQVVEFPQVDGTDFEYWGVEGPFPSSRGTYHYSSHTHRRYQEVYQKNGDNGPMVQMKLTEMEMLKAEGLLWTGGDLGAVAALINNTRVARGQLNPATAADGAGSVSDDQSHLDSASLWAKLKHEKRIECFNAGSAVAFNDDRGWGDLVSNTAIHFPVPGSELEVLQLANYTFGGGGPGSAPKVSARDLRPEKLDRVK
ncbi:MAG: hypothetical protein ACE5G0_17560 [Rhodothermales bacterium]